MGVRLAVAAGGADLFELHDLRRFRIRQRFENQAVDDAVHRRAGADGRAERQHGDDGESGGAPKKTRGKAQIACKGSHTRLRRLAIGEALSVTSRNEARTYKIERQGARFVIGTALPRAPDSHNSHPLHVASVAAPWP